MADVTIQGVVGGEKTTPVGTDTLEIQETSNGTSYWATLANLAAYVATVNSTCLVIAAGDEETALTVAAGKVTFRMPYAYTLTDIRASVTTAPTGASVIADVAMNGTSIMTTNKLEIEASEKSTEAATTQPALTTTALTDDAEITIDVDQIGSAIAGAGLKIYLIGYVT
jgi:hypothetical protein